MSEDFLKKANPEVMAQLVCGSNVLTEDEYKDIVLAISEYACSIVSKTLGPYGRTTNVDDSTFTAPTKDGWTVLRNIKFSDPLYNSIYNVINQISFDLVTKVGDGTTSALTGANIFMHLILEKLNDSDSLIYKMRQQDLLSVIEEVKTDIVNALNVSPDIQVIDESNEYDEIFRIAKVSANGNEKLAKIIQDIYQKTSNPNIYVTLDSGDEITSEIQEGYKLDCGVLNQRIYRNSDDGTYKLDIPIKVAVFDHNITYNEHKYIITELSKYASDTHTTVLILAPYFDDIMMNILNTTLNNYVQRNAIPNLVLAQIPLSIDFDRQTLTDFLMLTNGQVFDYGKVRALNVTMHNKDPRNAENKIEDDLLDIKQYQFDDERDLIKQCIGTINRCIIGEKYVIISNYESVYNKSLYDTHIQEVTEEFKEIARRTNKSSNLLTKDYLYAQQRYIKLLGKMGTIKVGGQTELQKHCFKDWVDDAVLACRSAMNNGYIRGLNLTTIKTISDLMEKTNEDKVDGELLPKQRIRLEVLEMFWTVFKQMTYMVLENKYPTNPVTGELSKYYVTGPDNFMPENGTIETDNVELVHLCVKNGFSFNLVKDELEVDWSIINSLATDVEILNSIVGVLSILLTSNQYISINKGYDRKMNKEMTNKRKIEDAYLAETGRLKARLEFFKENDMTPEIMAYVFGSDHM